MSSKQRASYQKKTSSQKPNYYEILGVPQNALADDIKNRYRALTLKFHPDREGSCLAKDAMVSINEAYEVLSDPQKRLAYDVTLQENLKETVLDEKQKTRCVRPHLTKLLIGKKRTPPLIIFIVVFSIAYQAGGQTNLTHDDAKIISYQFMENTGTSYNIIPHDAVLAMPLFIPVFGIVWGMLAAISAGTVDKAIVTVSPTLHISGAVLLYTTSFGIMKLLAYSVGMSRSLALADSIRKKRCGRDLVATICDAVMITSLLTLSGLVEHAIVGTG